MLTPAGNGFVAGAVLSCVIGFVLGYQALIGLGVGLGLAVTLAVLTVRRSSAATVRRTLSATKASRGSNLSATITVSTHGSIAGTGVILNEFDGVESLVVDVGTRGDGDAVDVSFDLRTDKRGVWTTGPTTIRQMDPWRLASAVRTLDNATTFEVRPRVRALSTIRSREHRGLEAPTSERAPLGNQSFHQLREYVPGDDRRMIHWKSYARTGVLVVRQHVDPTLPRLALIVDLDRSAYPDDAFEVAADIAASLITQALSERYAVTMVYSDGTVLVPSEDGGSPDWFLSHLTTAAVADVGPAELLEVTSRWARQFVGERVIVLSGTESGCSEVALMQAARGAQFTRVGTGKSVSGSLEVASLDEFVDRWPAEGRR